METDYTEKDILIELNRRFYIHRYSDGTCSLRTKHDWYIYYAEDCNTVHYNKGKSVLKETGWLIDGPNADRSSPQP